MTVADERPAVVQAAPAQAGARHVLFMAAKNEAPFLLEWIAYHRVIGFDEIVIASNPSTDGTNELLDALAQNGVVRHLSSLPVEGQSPQAAAHAVFEQSLGYRDGDWYLWLDADEFLNVQVGSRRVQDLVTAIGDRDGAVINWRMFGSNGHATFPGRFISSHFDRGAELGSDKNREVKTIFRKGEAVEGFSGYSFHRPSLSPSKAAKARFINGLGDDLVDSSRGGQRWRMGLDRASNRLVDPAQTGWRFAQINHYSVRTPEFFALKRLRGRGAAADQAGVTNRRHTDQFFAENDLNDVEDRSILAWEDATTREMAALAALPGVEDALLVVRERVAADLARLASMSAETATQTSAPARRARLATAGEVGGFTLTFPQEVADFVKETYARAGTILEYGGGGSTMIAAGQGCRTFVVESDKVWAESLRAALTRDGHSGVDVVYADIGATVAWGRPKDGSGFARYHRYALSVWDAPDFVAPDVVLIDGRFRRACFAATVLRATRPVTVLFDDYTDRPNYHDVERLFPVVQTVGRMAVFHVTPGPVPPGLLTQVIGSFTDPS